MQNSSEFQYIAIDQIHESITNPRKTFEETKLAELTESIRSNGLIQPITVRPNLAGFEIVTGARRFRAAQLAELFSLPARIVEIDDSQAIEWQLVENSQRVDVHPYEEAQGFQRLLDMPGYDVAALVEKSGKSAAHVYARLSLLQLAPSVAEAFQQERITASHANLLARLPQDVQQAAYEQCWRKDWQDREPHLLPAKHLSAWIQTHLYLALADAPFDRADATLNTVAGACVTCSRRSGFNTSLFADVQGDQCLDGTCYQIKVAAHIDRELAARPELVKIETTWRPAKEQRPGTLQKHSYRELADAENQDAEPACPNTRTALIVYGREAGKTLSVCTATDCPVHDAKAAARRARQEEEYPSTVMASSEPEETEEEAAERQTEYERQKQRQEAEAEREHRTELRTQRQVTFERIIANAPETFTAAQMRFVLRTIVHLDPYSFLEEVANRFSSEEDIQRSDEEIVLSALESTTDGKLTGFALRLALTDHIDTPREGEPDFLTEAEQAFRAPKPQKKNAGQKRPTPIRPAKAKKSAASKKRLAA